MTRCSYIPPEGQSVIAVATQRGGTTDGDLQALRDRFGCKVEARYHAFQEYGEGNVYGCCNHLGHQLDGCDGWSVNTIEKSTDVAISIVQTDGVAREVFGSPMILYPATVAEMNAIDVRDAMAMASLCTCGSAGSCSVCRRRKVVNLGTNPTREQAEAHGFIDDSAAYREALDRIRRLSAAPDARSRIEADRLAYGTGFGRRHPDGRLEHIPTPEMIVDRMPTAQSVWGEAIVERDRPTHSAGAGFRQVTVRPIAAPPYSVSDEVEWRPGPLETNLTPGRVTSIIDDRPNDGIDKPFWIVRVDTAGERRFAGPALAMCLRRRAARNEAGVIIDRAFCEPYERMGSYLTTAWRCRHCNRDVFSYALASAVIQPSTCCGAPAEQIRLADAGTFTAR